MLSLKCIQWRDYLSIQAEFWQYTQVALRRVRYEQFTYYSSAHLSWTEMGVIVIETYNIELQLCYLLFPLVIKK